MCIWKYDSEYHLKFVNKFFLLRMKEFAGKMLLLLYFRYYIQTHIMQSKVKLDQREFSSKTDFPVIE